MTCVSLLSPPVALAVVLFAVLVLGYLFKLLAHKKRRDVSGRQPYACGEEAPPSDRVQPDYAQFLPFALFFTILHVAALTVATVPVGGTPTFVIAVVYVVGALAALSVLYSR